MHQPFYASSQINRHGDLRSDKNLIEKIISDKETKFVPVLNGKNLFKQTKDDIEACVAFIQGLHGARKFVGAETIPPAAEASPAPNDVVIQIVARRRRFDEVSAAVVVQKSFRGSKARGRRKASV